MKRLFNAAAGLEGKVGKFRAGDWWAALILIAWDSGERIGAIIALDWANVDLDRGWVRFIAEQRKGARVDSTVRLSTTPLQRCESYALSRDRCSHGHTRRVTFGLRSPKS